MHGLHARDYEIGKTQQVRQLLLHVCIYYIYVHFIFIR